LKAGKTLPMTVRLPPAAVTALGKGATESAVFTLAARGALGGTGRVQTIVSPLKGG
jgi:hypothetical protein